MEQPSVVWRPPPHQLRVVEGRKPKPKPLDPARFYGSAPETDTIDSVHQKWFNPETDTPQLGPGTFENLIGNTPLVDVSGLLGPEVLSHPDHVTLLAKIEFLNPSLSTEDRVVRAVFDRAESSGDLRSNMAVVVTGSTDFCTAAAMLCAIRGFGCVVCASSSLSMESSHTLNAYGARVVTCPECDESNPEHPINAARRLCSQHVDLFFYLNDFETDMHSDAFYNTLGPEIWNQSNGTVTHFVSRAQPLMGAGRFLHEMSNGRIKAVTARPSGPLFKRFAEEGGTRHDEPSPTQDDDLIIEVSDQECLDACHRLCREEGVCAGALSGINMAAALKLADTLKNQQDNQTKRGMIVVTDLPDLGVHFLPTIFNLDWMVANGIKPPEDQVVPGCLNLNCPGCSRGLVCPRLGSSSPISSKRPPPPVKSAYHSSDFKRYEHLIGNTPIIDLSHFIDDTKCKSPGQVKVFAKCEMFNPGFSLKDRIARNILDKAEKTGSLRPGMCVVAASSGNTGAATAMLCAMRGYSCVITTDKKCSKEKMDAIKAYGATLMVAQSGLSEDNPDHYMNLARRLCAQNPGLFFDVDQYDTKMNPEGHFLTLGPEIYEQTGAENGCTHFICAGSTGGTVSGVGCYLKQQNKDIKIVLADPVGSVFTNYFKHGEVGRPGKYLVEGVGKGSIPGAMDMSLVDAVLPVTDKDAFEMCLRLAREEGICAGGSAGLNVFSALKLAEQVEGPCTIVTVMPDSGVKYMSKVYNPEWLLSNNLAPPAPVNVYGLPPQPVLNPPSANAPAVVSTPVATTAATPVATPAATTAPKV